VHRHIFSKHIDNIAKLGKRDHRSSVITVFLKSLHQLLFFQRNLKISTKQHKLSKFHELVLIIQKLKVLYAIFMKSGVKWENFAQSPFFLFWFWKFETKVCFGPCFVNLSDKLLVKKFNFVVYVFDHLLSYLTLSVVSVLVFLCVFDVLL